MAPASCREQPKKDYPFICSSQPGFSVPKRAHSRADPSPVQSPPSAASESTVAPRPFQFTASDMILFHHCLSAKDLKGHIPDQLIRLGLSVHYVLHLLLAIAGFHLSEFPGDDSVGRFMEPTFDCYAEAERHLSTAIKEFAATGSQLHEGNHHVIYIASVFVFLCSLARGPQPGEYLGFRDDTDMPGLHLFLGMRSILENINSTGSSPAISEVQPRERQHLSPQKNTAKETNQFPSASTAIENDRIQYLVPLNDLRNLITGTFSPNDSRHSAYVGAFELLLSRYDSILGSPAPVIGPGLWPELFSWLYVLPDIVTAEMQQRHPVALLLFSYFAVLLNELDFVWFIRKWPSHIVRAVSHTLADYHRPFLLWPLKRLHLLAGS